MHNDIALIRLPRPAVLNSAVHVVCLPLDAALAAAELGVEDLRAGLEGRYPQVVGWGHTHPLALQWAGDKEEMQFKCFHVFYMFVIRQVFVI